MFHKWTEIINHYQEKEINNFFLYNQGLKEETFVVTEKVDGSNFSFLFKSDGSYQVYKRKGIAENNFYNWNKILEDKYIEDFIRKVLFYCKQKNKSLQFVGELFGKGIQKRIYYGESVYWKWFAIYEIFPDDSIHLYSLCDEIKLINDILSTYTIFNIGKTLVNSSVIPDLLVTNYRNNSIDFLRVPILYKSTGKNNLFDLFKRINKIIRQNSKLTPENYDKFNLMEGMVIRPYERDYFHNHKTFIIKYKNPEFADILKKKKIKINKVYSEDLQNLINIGGDYINKNRTLDLFSKEGEMGNMKQLGNYIKLYAYDFFNDFYKDYLQKYKNLKKEEQKIFNKQINLLIVRELKNKLIKEE